MRSFFIVQKVGDSLSNLVTGTYSEEEKRILLELSEERLPIKEIAEKMNRSYISIRNARKLYWKNREIRKSYSKEDERKIEKMYFQGKKDLDISVALGISESAIANYRFKRNLTDSSRFWTEEDTETLLMYLILDHRNRVVNTEELAEQLSRSSGAILSRVQQLRKENRIPEAIVKRAQRFTEEESNQLIQLRKQGIPIATIAKQLEKSVIAVSDKLNALGITLEERNWWTAQEEQLLLDTVQFCERGRAVNLTELQQLLNRSEKSIKMKVVRMRKNGQLPGIQYANHQAFLPWGLREEQLFIYLWKQNESIEFMSRKLDRSESAIFTKSLRLKSQGIIQQRYNSWTDEEIQFILDNVIYDKTDNVANIYEISRNLPNHPIGSILNKIGSLRKEGKIRPRQGINEKVRDSHDRFNQMRHAQFVRSDFVNVT